jgi:hypothetical protein
VVKFKAHQEVANTLKTKNKEPASIKTIHSFWDQAINKNEEDQTKTDSADDSDNN